MQSLSEASVGGGEGIGGDWRGGEGRVAESVISKTVAYNLEIKLPVQDKASLH